MSTRITDSNGNIFHDESGVVTLTEDTLESLRDFGPKVAVTTLTSAQVKALRGTPATLVAAPGAGKINIVTSVFFHLDYGSNVFTESSDNLVVQYGDSGTDITGSIETTSSWLTNNADAWGIAVPAAVLLGASATAGVNETIELFNTGDGEIGGNAGNDNVVKVVVTYHTVTI